MTVRRSERKHEDERGTVTTRWLNPTTVETTYTGFVTTKLVQLAAADFSAMLRERPAHYRIVDASSMTGIDSAGRGRVEEMWDEFKKLGGREILYIGKAPIDKMKISVVAMNEAMRIQYFDTRAQALAYLATLTP